MKKLLIISAILLVIACFPLPYGYYIFLRIAITIVSVLALVQDLDKGISAENIGWVAVAILFNPIIPVYLPKSIWVVMDLLSAAWFSYKGLKS